jgi:hypothetical protein
MKYLILCRETESSLEYIITYCLTNGGTLVGGPFSYEKDRKLRFAQAVLMPEKYDYQRINNIGYV